MALGNLRQELSIYPAPASKIGAPNWTIYDPTRNLYFQIDWLSFEVLSRWHLGDIEQISKAVNQETTLEIDTNTVLDVYNFLAQRELLSTQKSQHFSEKSLKRKQHPLKWLLHRYLFFRIPLFRPDTFITNTLPSVRWLGSQWFLYLTVCILGLSGVLLSHEWDGFVATLIDLFSWQGLIAYFITLVFIKTCHELGHAYVAKHYGCRVPTMGIAFLVLFPMAYTDVNDVWRLQDKKQRLNVGAAGIRVELMIAIWATLLWTLMPDGAIRTGLFLLATTTWISTLLINLSPFLRFDGYFLLMDWVEQPNLHASAFELARWKLRRTLFGFNDPQPQRYSRDRTRFLLVFAWLTWLYRAVVFISIAILVYFMFPKPLGQILAVIELYWFIIKPVLSEVSIWCQRWKEVVSSMRSGITLCMVLAMVAVVAVPWDKRVSGVALQKQVHAYTLSIEQDAKLEQLNVEHGSTVLADQILAVFSSDDLDMQLQIAQNKVEQLRLQLDAAAIDLKSKMQLPVIQKAHQKALAEQAGIAQQKQNLTIKSPYAGKVFWQDPELEINTWYAGDSTIGTVYKTKQSEFVAYVDQNEIDRLTKGDEAVFYYACGCKSPIKMTLAAIESDAVRVLKDEVLASVYGGSILVRESNQGQLVPEATIYKLILETNTFIDGDKTQIGRVVIKGEAESWLRRFYESAAALFWREAGF